MSKKIFYISIAIMISLCCLTFTLFVNKGYTIRTAGTLYIVNKASRTISVFDLENGKHLSEVAAEIEPHEATTVHNQKYVVVTNYGNENTIGKSLTVISTQSNQIEKIIDLGVSAKPHGITLIPNTNKVIVASDVGEDIVVVDIASGVVEKRIPTQGKLSHLLALHPDNKTAYVSNIASNDVSIIDLEKGILIEKVNCGMGAEGLDVSPDGKEIWVANNGDNSISIIDSKTRAVIQTIKTEKQPLRLKFSGDGKFCLVANAQNGSVGVYHPKTREKVKEILFPGKENIFQRAIYHTPRPVGILIHPNNKYAFIANSNADRVEVIDLQSLKIVSSINTGSIPDGMAITK